MKKIAAFLLALTISLSAAGCGKDDESAAKMETAVAESKIVQSEEAQDSSSEENTDLQSDEEQDSSSEEDEELQSEDAQDSSSEEDTDTKDSSSEEDAEPQTDDEKESADKSDTASQSAESELETKVKKLIIDMMSAAERGDSKAFGDLTCIVKAYDEFGFGLTDDELADLADGFMTGFLANYEGMMLSHEVKNLDVYESGVAFSIWGIDSSVFDDVINYNISFSLNDTISGEDIPFRGNVFVVDDVWYVEYYIDDGSDY